MVAAAKHEKPESAILLREDRGSVALLILNRPEARNTLTEEMLLALSAALEEIGKDRAVRALVLAANGPVFCAGHDLKELTGRRGDADKGRAFFTHIFHASAAVMQAIVHLPQPVIAAVQGMATAAGCQLVASCDLAVASESARFCTPGVDIGLFCSAPMVALTRKIAANHAMEMLLTGEPINAKRAQEIGLLNRAVTAGSEREEAIALASRIAAKSAFVQGIGKKAFYRQLEMGLEEAYRYTSEVMAKNMLARDAEEGIGAFLCKRAPKWEDR